MKQPPGFVNPNLPTHVCKLKKAIYGLKQAPYAWFHGFSSFLFTVGFTCSASDTSIFTDTRQGVSLILVRHLHYRLWWPIRTLIGQDALPLHHGICCFLRVLIWCLGDPRNNRLCQNHPLKLNTGLLHIQSRRPYGFTSFLLIWVPNYASL